MSKSVCEVERVSDDFYDYNRENYDYVQMELHNENFVRAPPISVAEYRARTLEVLPQGIFDDNDVPGILIAGKGTRFYDDFVDKEKDEVEIDQKNEMNGNDVTIEPTINKEESKGPSKPKSKNQKKKTKFKPFDFTSSTGQSHHNQPWMPNFADKFKDDKAFPPL